jgi:hypothetical protein
VYPQQRRPFVWKPEQPLEADRDVEVTASPEPALTEGGEGVATLLGTQVALGQRAEGLLDLPQPRSC